MQYRKLGNVEVPVIGMGTWQSFDVRSQSDIDLRRQIVENCIESGMTLVDSSPMYGQSERIVGVTTEDVRDQFQFATKVWTRGKSEGERQMAESFKLMRTDHIELMQIHNLVDWRTHLPTLERLKDEGKIDVIGVTHNSSRSYGEIADIMRSGRIGEIQIPYNVGERACEAEILPLAQELGIGVLVMEPLEKGRYVTGLRNSPDLTPLAEFGIETWAQALLAWVVSHPAVTSAIPATSRPERIFENAKAGDAANLPAEIRDYIREETMRCL